MATIAPQSKALYEEIPAFPPEIPIHTINVDKLSESITITGKKKVTVIESGLGTGKTTLACDYLRSTEGSCLVVSTRRFFTTATKPDFESKTGRVFQTYMDEMTWANNPDNYIVQAESLHHVCRDYDVLVLDEITTFIKQFDSKLHGERLFDNRLALTTLISYAKKVICSTV